MNYFVCNRIKFFKVPVVLVCGMYFQQGNATSIGKEAAPTVSCQAEESCVNSQRGWVVKRSGNNLMIRSKSGKINKFKNVRVFSDAREEYTFVRFIPQVNALQISFAGWETSATIFIDYATGKRFEVNSGVTEFSPDGKHYALIDCDLEIDPNCALEIVRWNQYAAPDTVWDCKLPYVELAAPNWITDHQVGVAYESASRYTHPSINKNRTYIISKNNNKWSSNLPCAR